jgi:hypothetical protein
VEGDKVAAQRLADQQCLAMAGDFPAHVEDRSIWKDAVCIRMSGATKCMWTLRGAVKIVKAQ